MTKRSWARRFLPLGAALGLAGCAAFDPYSQAPIAAHLERADEVGDCARRLQANDILIAGAGVRDAGAPRVAGFPYLRVDRFRADLGRSVETEAQVAAWQGWLARLDAEARARESANAGLTPAAVATIDRCRALLARADRDELERLRNAAQVPDDYSMVARTLGLYPLTRIPFARGVSDWQADTLAAFAAPVEALPVRGERVTWVPSAEAVPGSSRERLARDRLDVPVPSSAQAAALLARHAPVLAVDVASPADRIGRLGWGDDGGPRVDPARPAVYTRVAYTFVAGRPALQLVYTAWFEARPATRAFDLLSGRLDGLVWRVTLDEAGEALAYDSIHPCGCYHLFFPTERVRARPQPTSLDEAMFAPQTTLNRQAGHRVALLIESGTHYLQRVDFVDASSGAARRYELLDETELQSLPTASGGHRSLYGEDGLVAGTERTERWLFWPMGVASAGAMRQWGRHATAFVGRRHFDDPMLFDRYFELMPPAAVGVGLQ